MVQPPTLPVRNLGKAYHQDVVERTALRRQIDHNCQILHQLVSEYWLHPHIASALATNSAWDSSVEEAIRPNVTRQLQKKQLTQESLNCPKEPITIKPSFQANVVLETMV